MPRYDFRTPRLFVDQPLAAGATITLDSAPAHYLKDVLRLKAGHAVLIFNGSDGEWRADIADIRKHAMTLDLREQTRPQTVAPDVHYLFAPLKRARLDYMVQKAVEMGVSRLQPVVTHHTQAERVKTARMRANAIEAAEQCGILALPEIMEPVALDRAIAALGTERRLIFCDEDAPIADPIAALATARRGDPLAVLIGPEGGFSEGERESLLRHPRVLRLPLGPRILRADTAGVAALALVQAVLGDWR